MTARILVLHPTSLTVEPMELAFRRQWPQASRLNLVDESLYEDLDGKGTITPHIVYRIRLLFEYCIAAHADAVIFNGTTFGPAVDEARNGLQIPVIKPIEALASEIRACGKHFVMLSTSQRSIPVILKEIEASAAGADLVIEGRWVAGARDALMAGDKTEHDRLIAAAADAVTKCDGIILGQVTMAAAGALIRPVAARVILTSPDSAVRQLTIKLGR